MGRFILDSTKMKVLIAGLLCATVAMALPEGRRLRPEEYWRPAQGRDLSKYQPRHALVNAKGSEMTWDEQMVMLTKAAKQAHKNGFSTKKGTNQDIKATCGIEGPPSMAGAHNVRQASEPHRVEITSYNGWTHPGWNTQDLSNDIALIELPSPIDFNDYIKPSCMPADGDTADVGELV